MFGKSSTFEECIIVFQVLVYISKCYRFLKSALSFSKPQLNLQKITMSGILLSIDLNFGCSSYIYIIHTSHMWLNSVEEKHQAVNHPSQIGIPKFINPRGAWCLAVGSCHDIICRVAQYPTQKYQNVGCRYRFIVSYGLPSPG